MNLCSHQITEEDIAHYEAYLAAYRVGKMDAHVFTNERLLRGIYAQRQAGAYMVRTKLPGGELDSLALYGLAEALERHACTGGAWLTSRQNVQINGVALDETPALLRLLASHGVTTREAGGNTLRNVTVCPLAGACPWERVDMQPYATAMAKHFLHHPLIQSLPRKFKIALSGCATDCALGGAHDLGFIAEQRDGKAGFKVLAGGGLGAKPRFALLLEPFIEEADLLPVTEAVLVLHERLSPRDRKSRARLKFLVERLGEDAFRTAYRQELQRVRAAFVADEAPSGRWHSGQKCRAFWNGPYPGRLDRPTEMAWDQGLAMPVAVPAGTLSPNTFRGLARLLDSGLVARLRVTQSHELLLLGVAEAHREACLDRLAALGLAPPAEGDDLVGCPGTDTCPLGITASQRMVGALSGVASGLRVRVSGCHNCCVGAETADIGLIGKARRYHGRMVPVYALKLGGGAEGFGFTGPDIPAKRLPAAIERIVNAFHADRRGNEAFDAWSRAIGVDHFHELLAREAEVREDELAFLCRDWGDEVIFNLAAVGANECAGSLSSPVDRLLLNAAYESTLRRAFAAKQKYTEAAECLLNRVRLTGRALCLAACGEEGASGVLLAATLGLLSDGDRLLAEQARIERTLIEFSADMDELRISSLTKEVEAWAGAVRRLCRRLQSAEQPTPLQAAGR